MTRTTNIPTSITASIASLIGGLRYESIPPLGIERARASIVDFIGCALEGAGSAVAAAVRNTVAADGGKGESQVFGHALRLPATGAALVNGTAGHVLDFDDSSPPMIGHPSSSLVPALFALGEPRGVSGREIITAYVAGLEVGARLGRHLNPSHYAAGWHATATFGTLAAASASAKLLQLDDAGIRTTLGIAASSVSGIRKNFGSGVKPLHAGLAARNGVLAALLAQNGMTADLDVLDGERGFIDVYRGELLPDLGAIRFDADQDLEIVASGISIKPYACCGCTHSAVDAILILRERHAIEPDQVAAIECTMNSLVPDILVYSTPTSGSQAKFSMEYCLAVALIDGDCGTQQFSATRLADPLLQALLRRVTTSVDPAIPYRNGVYPGTVTVRMKNGEVWSQHVDEAQGHPDKPLALQQMRRKFLACAGVGLPPAQAATAFDALCALESCADITQLTSHLKA